VADASRVVIVDPQPLFRAGLAHVLNREPDFAVVGMGSNSADVLRLLSAEAPDLIFLDIADVGVKTMVDAIRSAPKPVRVMVLTCSERHEDVTAALRAGASGYMLKSITPETLLQTLRMVNAGEAYVMPKLVASLLTGGGTAKPSVSQSASDAQIESLTVRERQILHELAGGQTNKEIARQLQLSEKTVKHYMGRVLQKLCVRNRTEAVIVSQASEQRANQALSTAR
jgi:two-component system nitrate/nitrite response regulator NarL